MALRENVLIFVGSPVFPRGHSGEIMKTNLVRAALACAVLAVSAGASSSYASLPSTVEDGDGNGNELPGVHVVVKQVDGGTVLSAATDSKGYIAVDSLRPGRYEIFVDGPSLMAAVDKIAPPPKKSSGLNVGIGGGFFGGSSHSSSSHQGAGPAQGTSHPSGTTTNSGDSGVSVNLNQMVARDSDSGSANGNVPMITFTATVNPSSPGSSAPTGTVSFLSETPYCRDTALQGMRIGFTVPEGAPVAFKSNLRVTWYSPSD